jgi:hypothetical protein
MGGFYGCDQAVFPGSPCTGFQRTPLVDHFHTRAVAIFRLETPAPVIYSIFAERRNTMLETIAVILIVLWFLGFVSSYTMGGLIHILLVVAVVVILVRVIQGRRL